MFTFGREREMEHVEDCHAGRTTASLLRHVVASIHDFIDGTATASRVETAIEHALIDGESGIWETAGSWLLKLNNDAPETRDLWLRLVRHPRASVRFRIASFLDYVPEVLAGELYQQLSADRSTRVRAHAKTKWDYRRHPERYGAYERDGA